MDKEFLFKVAPAACEIVSVVALGLSKDVALMVLRGERLAPGQMEDAVKLLDMAMATIRHLRRILRRHGVSEELEEKIERQLAELALASVGMTAAQIRMDMDLKKETPPAAPDSAAQEGT